MRAPVLSTRRRSALERAGQHLITPGSIADAAPSVFTNFATFAAVSSTFEDLGVAAYKGQAPFLLGTPTLTVALRIHSVEARHAAEVRRVRGLVGFDRAFDAPKTKLEVLAAAGPFITG